MRSQLIGERKPGDRNDFFGQGRARFIGGQGCRLRSSRQEQHPQSLVGPFVDLGRKRRLLGEQRRQHFGRAERNHAAPFGIVETEGTPFSGRREVHFVVDRPLLARRCGGHSFGRLVAGSDGRREIADQTADRILRGISNRDHLVETQFVGGQGAGFIETENIDVAERIDRVRRLNQRILAGDFHRGHGVVEGDHQKEARWHEPGNHGRRQHRFGDRGVIHDRADQQQPAETGGHEQQHPQDQIDFQLKRGQGSLERACARGDPGSETVVADACGLDDRTPGHADRAGMHFHALRFRDQIFLAGQQ